ncbi:MAG: hypothetical protein M3Z06_03175 [Actinomycetota bacterium]|nr:hypothetical protein [Actinomycetota bacterium]
MAKPRFVLRFQGDGAKPADDVARIRDLPEASIIDESSARMMLVESREQPLRALVDSLPGWALAPEQTIPLPDTRERIKRPPG